MDLQTWEVAEARIDAEQIADGRALLDRLPRSFVESLTPREALALRHEPKAYLRPRQLPPPGDDWLTWVLCTGRSFGKTFAAAAWVVARVLEGTPAEPADYLLVAPSLQLCETLQVDTIRALLPPWVRVVPRLSHQQILFPDHGGRLIMHSAENAHARGYNARGAWLEEIVAYPAGGKALFQNLRRALRTPGTTPARCVITTTPPFTLDHWLLDLMAQPSTKVTRGRARDNPYVDRRNIESWYADDTIEARRENDGAFIWGVDGALFKIDDLEAARVSAAPPLTSVVVAVDPAMSGGKYADTVGVACLGFAAGHFYVLESCSERLEPIEWATRALTWAAQHRAGRIVVEATGAGSFPRATLEQQMRIDRTHRFPVVDTKAIGSKTDRAMPLSAACAAGRLHLVGGHAQLERELTTWSPGAPSPGGLDAVVHAAATVSNNHRSMR